MYGLLHANAWHRILEGLKTMIENLTHQKSEVENKIHEVENQLEQQNGEHSELSKELEQLKSQLDVYKRQILLLLTVACTFVLSARAQHVNYDKKTVAAIDVYKRQSTCRMW